MDISKLHQNILFYQKFQFQDIDLHIFADEEKIFGVFWNFDSALEYFEGKFLFYNSSSKALLQCKQQLQEYFEGKRSKFDLQLQTFGTEFQKKAWQVLQNIEFAKSISYKEQAEILGNAKAVQAIGTANSRNPISIIIPCHRVIKSSGDFGEYAGGMERKNFLLSLEKAHSDKIVQQPEIEANI